MATVRTRNGQDYTYGKQQISTWVDDNLYWKVKNLAVQNKIKVGEFIQRALMREATRLEKKVKV